MAVEAVCLELVSVPEIPVLQGKYRESAGQPRSPPGPIGPSTRIRRVFSARRLRFPTTENREICASEQRVQRANRGRCDVINSARRQIFESGNSDEYVERTGSDRLTRAVLWPIQMTESTRISCRLSFGTLRGAPRGWDHRSCPIATDESRSLPGTR